MGGVKDGGEGAWFVARKDMATNTLWIVRGHDHPWLMTTRVVFDDASWVAGASPRSGVALTAKTRYRQDDAACRFALHDDRCVLTFDEPQWAVTPRTVGGAVRR